MTAPVRPPTFRSMRSRYGTECKTPSRFSEHALMIAHREAFLSEPTFDGGRGCGAASCGLLETLPSACFLFPPWTAMDFEAEPTSAEPDDQTPVELESPPQTRRRP